MATRNCSSCGTNLPKSEYSKNQWSKKEAAKCKSCVAEGKAALASHFAAKTNHLVQRQRQRDISDEELAAAIQYGEKIQLSREDGTVRYSYKGVVYVATSDGVGITAYRLDPLQCTCNVKDQSQLRSDYGDEYLERRKCSRVEHAVQRFVLDLMRLGGCENMTPSEDNPDPFCMGGNMCNVHRTPTDPLAVLLEKQKWASPNMQDVMADPNMVGYLLLAAAGSLLRPVMCRKCRGVKQLCRSPNPYDESDTLPWIRHLLDVMKANKKNQQRMEELKRSVPDLWMDVNVAGCTSALGAAALAGHYRCAVELLKNGASVDMALAFYGGPLAGGHLPCYLLCKSVVPSNRQFRQMTMCSRHEEVLALLAYAEGNEGFCAKTDEQQDRAVQFLKDVGLWELMKVMFEAHGFSVLGSMWDGLCHRFIIKGPDDEYASGAVVVSSVAIQLPEAGQQLNAEEPTYADPVGDPVVLEFVRRHQRKAKKRHHGKSCCCFSHHVDQVLKDKQNLIDDDMLRAVEERWKKMSI